MAPAMFMYFEGEYIPLPPRIGNWLLEEKLGSGFSGAIWRAINPYTGQVAAIKLQHVDHECPTNQYERLFYPSLQGGRGMPTLWASGVQGVFDYLVIDLLGPSLDSLYRQLPAKVMDLRSVLSIAMQVITRLEFMHSRGILHRDIQLGNCVVGLGPYAGTIFMIDFGFSKFYLDRYTHAHIPDSRKKRDFIGNYWFSSVNVHCRGRVPSRRDDLEALALMLIHLLTPNGLPWTRNGVPKYSFQGDVIISEKLRARPEDLCRGLPDVFEDFLRYCRRLKFAECPDYARWREEFASLAFEHGWTDQYGYVREELIWPPVVEVQPIKTAPSRQAKGVDVEAVLGEIANMNLNGQRESVLRNIQQDAEKEEDIDDDEYDDDEDEEDDDDDESEEDGESEISTSSDPQSSQQGPRTPVEVSLPTPNVQPTIIAVSNERSTSLDEMKTTVPPIQVLSGGTSSNTGSSDSSPGKEEDQLQGRRERNSPSQDVRPAKTAGNDGSTATSSQHKADTSNATSPLRKSDSEVIVISSGDESDLFSTRKLRVETRWLKAAAIKRLTAQISKTVDNITLSRLMHQFIEVLHSNNSKFMTKEGFAFLDALESQMSDPDVFVIQSSERCHVTRGGVSQDPLDGIRKRAGHAETIKFLRQRILSAPQTFTNSDAGGMIDAFTKALKRSGNRTVTKDGFAFLAGIEAYLQRT